MLPVPVGDTAALGKLEGEEGLIGLPGEIEIGLKDSGEDVGAEKEVERGLERGDEE